MNTGKIARVSIAVLKFFFLACSRPAMSSPNRLANRAFSGAIITFPGLKNSPALHQSYDQNDHGNDQKNVDKAGGMECEEPQSPTNKQND
jgi:hypothetical protein